ncbi:sigma-70 family RNA polymerase sigma factor [Paraburkholderia humisilvae]|uniref:ECF RNA polymerase sigma factor SigF n=1 Tax=Paraburkholderia humisilvae TaxID=627669 RepID=A0A6J5DRA8_9BURK|nr:sigma-70 family RNA polymerase sigma factor [Paraburkholderia humisilvae]CAB3755386.1 ECF RNA polymerase sigma factor SigF [Paraburkholderia humisilvae]
MSQCTEGPHTHPVEERLRTLFICSLDGDSAAYHVFLQDLARHVRALLRKRLPNLRDDVEDVLQEVLIAIHKGRHTYRRDEPLTAWVHAILRYKLADFLRARARHEALHDPLDDFPELFAESEIEPAEIRRDLGKLLDTLPDRQKLPILHVKVEGRSVEETARATGLSEPAVKVGVHRGLKALALKIRGGGKA